MNDTLIIDTRNQRKTHTLREYEVLILWFLIGIGILALYHALVPTGRISFLLPSVALIWIGPAIKGFVYLRDQFRRGYRCEISSAGLDYTAPNGERRIMEWPQAHQLLWKNSVLVIKSPLHKIRLTRFILENEEWFVARKAIREHLMYHYPMLSLPAVLKRGGDAPILPLVFAMGLIFYIDVNRHEILDPLYATGAIALGLLFIVVYKNANRWIRLATPPELANYHRQTL